MLRQQNLTINRQGGNISFEIDAFASDGFSGTVAGTISVSQPVNSSGVKLTEGSEGKTSRFTLKAGEKTSETKDRQTVTFTVATSPQNQTSGTLLYIVGLDPSEKFLFAEPQQVKVTTVP